MEYIKKFRSGSGYVCAVAGVMSCIAEYYFCFGSWLAGVSAYFFVLFLVAVQTLAVSQIAKSFMTAFYERHSGKILVVTPVISAAVLSAMLMFSLMANADSNTEAFRSAVTFNLIPFVAAAVCVIVCKITRFIVRTNALRTK